MTVASHPDYAAIQAVVSAATGIPFNDTVVRLASPMWAKTTSMTNGLGALSGGRWNAPGTFPADYTATTLNVALAEFKWLATYYGLPEWAHLPRVLAALEVKGLTRVLDLTDRTIRRKLRVTIDAIKTEDWRATNTAAQEARTQAIGRAAHTAGFQGVYVPSARIRKGNNLVVFPGPTTPALTVVKGDELDAALK